ncbi:MAG: metallophosphoesterase family protein [Desulfurococcaceae archaeon]
MFSIERRFIDKGVLSRGVRNLVDEVHVYSQNASKYRELLEECSKTLDETPPGSKYLNPGIVKLGEHLSAVLVGDLHGDFYSLLTIMNSIWDYLEEKNHVVVFLGDYVDRGYAQIETLATVLYLKLTYPDRIVLLRGNHEPPKWLIPYPHDYPYQLEARFREEGRVLYELSLALFDKLPLVAIVENGFIALHGGPPKSVLVQGSFEESFEVGKKKPSSALLEEILWSDPVEMNIDYMPSPRGAGVLYGTRITNRVLELAKVKYLIRAHEAVNGTRRSHKGLVITVFSSPLVYGFRCAGLVKYIRMNDEYNLLEECIVPY